MPYVFGIDGGGTHSRAILMTDKGKVVFVGKGPSLNYHDIGAGQVSSTIKRLFNDALSKAHARPDECKGVCLGLAGAGQQHDRDILQPIFNDLFGKESYLLMGDAQIALVGGTLSEIGIIVLAGTGSMVYGRNEDNVEGRVGGYGPLLSDQGSGYHIGLEALKMIVQYHDDMEDKPDFHDLVFNHIGVERIGDFISWVNSTSATRERIASIAPIVIQAANEDDPLADEILNRQADGLAKCVDALHKRLSFPERADVVLSGGLFSDTSYFSQMLRRKIHYFIPGANVIAPKLDAVVGAALYALSLANVAIDEDLLDNVKRSFRECQLKSKESIQETPLAKKPEFAPEEEA